ncbi:aspartyl-phosphate phosphatase Spo0E family protein [Clostridium lacusfryxellense]|uniref:aspartyl-phosphate phosphatase Spo0E family protein n=1 Tax=Clostridium lacusfryxellense TaxID=205328 RepID=UPI001C0E550D|nr:aspartyl-phosphate phosphatase Spo0E family protein [Clostridium lacusfryxellense]MBU3114548.1 aspartyl-phosphate phosphatase Spo0E family protein [Clostridium lacusfryxellense]
MTQLQEIEQKIEKHRELMHQLINEKETLTDAKLVVLSQKLDGLLNEYDDLLD